MRPASILYIHNSAQMAGGNRVLLSLFEHLNRDRYRAVSILPASGPMEQELRSRAVPHRVVPFEPALTGGRAQALLLLWRLSRALRQEKIQLIHANDSLCYRHASIAARLTGAQRICHLHFPPVHAALAWSLRVRPHALLTCSKDMGRQLQEAGLACLSGVPVVPVENGIDTELYRPPADIRQLRRSLEIDTEAQVVTIVGSVSERKGHRDFLELAKVVLVRRPRTLFLVVGEDLEGNGAYRVAMQEYARALGIAASVRFLGFRSDTARWVAASDVIVLPSLKEGLPLSLAEAHGCGKPVVATRIDGIPEIVADGVTGFLFEPHDVEGMSTAVTRLLSDPALEAEMGAAGRRRAESIFSQRTHAAKIQALYERVLAGNSGHHPCRVPG
jgi:glycosyltransferase involved in cell wall biosynthesis